MKVVFAGFFKTKHLLYDTVHVQNTGGRKWEKTWLTIEVFLGKCGLFCHILFQSFQPSCIAATLNQGNQDLAPDEGFSKPFGFSQRAAALGSERGSQMARSDQQKFAAKIVVLLQLIVEGGRGS